MTTLRRPWAVWLALCMALLGALAPTVSHALVWAQGGQAPRVEICTSAGPRWMAFATQTDAAEARLEGVATDVATLLGSAPDPAPSPTAGLDHCPFCLLLADRMAPPSQPQPLCFAASGHAGVPAPPPTVVLPAQVLAAAHPRGPPVR